MIGAFAFATLSAKLTCFGIYIVLCVKGSSRYVKPAAFALVVILLMYCCAELGQTAILYAGMTLLLLYSPIYIGDCVP